VAGPVMVAPPPGSLLVPSVSAPPEHVAPLTVPRAFARYLAGDRAGAVADFRTLVSTWERDEKRKLLPCDHDPCVRGVTRYQTVLSGNHAWVGVVDDQGLVVCDAVSGRMDRFVPIDVFFQPLEAADEGSLVLFGYADDAALIDLATGAIALRWSGNGGVPTHALGAGKLAIVTGQMAEPPVVVLHVVDTRAGKEMSATPLGEDAGFRFLRLLDHGKLLVGWGMGRARVWDVAGDGALREWSGGRLPKGELGGIEVHPTARRLAFVITRNPETQAPAETVLLDLETGKLLAKSHACPEAGALAWNADGSRLAVGDRLHACVLDGATLRLVEKTPNLRGAYSQEDDLQDVGTLRFVGTRGLLVGLADPSVKLFELPSMRVLWSGGAEQVHEAAHGGLALLLSWDDGKPPANIAVVDEALHVTKRPFTGPESTYAVHIPEMAEEPTEVAARIASPSLCTLGRHVVPREVCE
jgi:hypothetical protein